jgi:3-phosphoshikimate 1-carboxyvinyltransferase
MSDMRYNIQLPDNKSLRIREMAFSYAMGKEVPPLCDNDCHDVEVMRRALKTLSSGYDETQNFTSLQWGTPSLHPVVVDVEDCGAAYRFLMPLLAATPGRWLLTGTPRLLQRPILPLVNVLRGIGVDIERVGDGWLISGKQFRSVETCHGASLQSVKTDANTDDGLSLTIDASQSSQLASALVLAAPLLGLRTLHLTTIEIPSLPYLQMTLACMRDYPVTVPGVSIPKKAIGAPGDWSAALFWFAYARLHPENQYSLSPLTLDSIQGDSVIYQWFNELNIIISTKDSSVEIHAKPLNEIPKMVLDVRGNLDTVPVMAVLASLLPADITFQNVHNLRLKESDRLQAIATQLQPYADIELKGEELHIVGKGCHADARPVFDTHHDHRLAMAFLLFGPNATLNDTDCLRKSYPGLLGDLRLIQGVMSVEE